MNSLIERVKSAMVGLGTGWILMLMLVLSVISLAIMLERVWLYWSLRDDIDELMRDMGRLLRSGDLEGARQRLEASRSAEAAVVIAGLVEADRGADAADEAMEGASALQRLKLEKRLAFLGTLGNNAPFIGLLGTVIGIVAAFDELSKVKMAAASGATQLAPEAVMGRISEALVATAIGILIAIPAVAAYNAFQRVVRGTVANTDALGHMLLAHLKAVPVGGAGRAHGRPAGARGPIVVPLRARRRRVARELSHGGRRAGSRRRDHGDQRHPAGRHHARAAHHLHGDDQDRARTRRSRSICRRRRRARATCRSSSASSSRPTGARWSTARRRERRRHPAARRTRRQQNPELRAVIKADTAVTHGRVIHVLDLLKQAHVTKIAFGVTPAATAPH